MAVQKTLDLIQSFKKEEKQEALEQTSEPSIVPVVMPTPVAAPEPVKFEMPSFSQSTKNMSASDLAV